MLCTVFFKRSKILGIFFLFMLFNHPLAHPMAEVPMFANFKSPQEFRHYSIPADLFELKNYPTSSTITLSQMDQQWLNTALIGLIAVMSGQSGLEDQAPNLGVYKPFFPKNPRAIPRMNFRTGNILLIQIFSTSNNNLWYKSFISFNRKSVTLISNPGDFFKSLGLEFIKLTKVENVDITTEDQKKFNFYYAYHFRSNNDPRIEVIVNVYPDQHNKKSNLPMTFDGINLLRHDK